MRILISWIGHTDLRAAGPAPGRGEVGPVCRLLVHQPGFGRVYLLNDLTDQDCRERGIPGVDEYRAWLGSQLGHAPGDGPVRVCRVAPIRNSYRAALVETDRVVGDIVREHGAEAEYHLLLSPGTPAMQVALVLVSRALPRRRLWATWRPDGPGEAGVEPVDWPVHVTLDAPLAEVVPGPGPVPDDQPPRCPEAFEGLLGTSRAIRQAVWLADRLGPCPEPVLIVGETGTGKELFARALLRCSGRAGPFVAVNCAGLPEALLESELFGYEKGAFTGATQAKPGLFQAADGGTLFLDEVGELAPALQAKLLRAVQERRVRPVGATAETAVDVRVLAATHRDLLRLVRGGAFREDLYYRLSTFVLRVPALRERGRDVVRLAEAFLGEDGGPGRPRRLTPDGARELQRYHWPGNVRELRQVAARLRVLLPDDVTDVAAEHVRFGREGGASHLPGRPLPEMTEREFLTRLAGDLDELIRRFNDGRPVGLPESGDPASEDRLLAEYLRPLLLGRAFVRAGHNGVRAGQALGRDKLERGKGDWRDRYAALAPFIDDRALGAGPSVED